MRLDLSLKNPVTPAGKVLDVALEAWAIFVVTAVAGSFAAFFQSGDSVWSILCGAGGGAARAAN